MLAGCSSNAPALKKKQLEEVEITVYSNYQDQFFYDAYGNLILEAYPNLSFNLITSTTSDIDQIRADIDQYKPDLILNSYGNYAILSQEGYFTDLKPLLSERKIKLEQFYPQMISSFENESKQLLGIAPLVNSDVIWYNKDLFDEYGVPYPTDLMSWEQTLQLAKQFENTDIVGLSTYTPASLFQSIARTKGWQLIDEYTNKLIINEAEWIICIDAVLNADHSIGTTYGDDFLKGKAAMYPGFLSMLSSLNEQEPFAWGMVTAPVDERTPNINSNLLYRDIFSIAQQSSDQQIVADMIEVLMSTESAPYLLDHNYLGSFSTITKIMEGNYSGVDFSTLWSQEMDTRPYMTSALSSSFSDGFYKALEATFKQAIQNNLSAEEAYTILYDKLTALHQKEYLSD